MFISERDESDNILNGQRARGAQTTRTTCKKKSKKIIQVLYGYFRENISKTFPHAFLRSIFFKTMNYTRVIKLCISYCDEDS